MVKIKKRYLVLVKEYHDGVLFNKVHRLSHWFVNSKKAISQVKRKYGYYDHTNSFGQHVEYKFDVMIKEERRFLYEQGQLHGSVPR